MKTNGSSRLGQDGRRSRYLKILCAYKRADVSLTTNESDGAVFAQRNHGNITESLNK